MSIELAMKKILPNAGTDLEHFVSSFATELLLTQKIAYKSGGNGDGQAEYIGFALPGTSAGQSKWLIKKLTYDASNRVSDVQFAGGKASFENEWDERAGFTYS